MSSAYTSLSSKSWHMSSGSLIESSNMFDCFCLHQLSKIYTYTCGSGPLHMHGRYESKLGVSGPSVWRSSFKTEKYCNWTGSRPEKSRHSACSYEFFDLSKAHSLWAQNLVTIFIDWFIMMTIERFIKWKNMQSIEGIKQLWSCIIYPKIVKNK